MQHSGEPPRDDSASALQCVSPSNTFASVDDRPLEIAIDDGLPAIDVDPVLFQRVVDNLLDNAHAHGAGIAVTSDVGRGTTRAHHRANRRDVAAQARRIALRKKRAAKSVRRPPRILRATA
jgi:hypothetical protein